MFSLYYTTLLFLFFWSCFICLLVSNLPLPPPHFSIIDIPKILSFLFLKCKSIVEKAKFTWSIKQLYSRNFFISSLIFTTGPITSCWLSPLAIKFNSSPAPQPTKNKTTLQESTVPFSNLTGTLTVPFSNLTGTLFDTSLFPQSANYCLADPSLACP